MNRALYFCRACGQEVKDADETCPNCKGNLKEVGRHITLDLKETVQVSDSFRVRQKRKGFKKFLKEITQQSSQSKNPELQNGVHEVRTIDKEQDEYHQTVKDARTGEVIHEEHESLSQHKNQPKRS